MNDILINSEFEAQVADGDFVVGDSNAQDVALMLKANQGEFRQWPTIGIGLNQHLSGSDLRQLKNDFETQVNGIEGKDAQIRMGADGSVAIEL